MSSSSAALPERRRADVERNTRRILDAAAQVLARHAGAGMAEIATAAGLGRATLYRHFRGRDELIEALHEQAFADAGVAIGSCRLDDGPVPDALRRVIAALLEVAVQYHILFDDSFLQRTHSERQAERRERLAAPIARLVERGQRQGELAPELPARWVGDALGSLLLTGLRLVVEGELTHERARELAGATLLDGVRARR
jgi:TetR/AcrR family transcriptional repressor of mexCD-oprJ operon